MIELADDSERTPVSVALERANELLAAHALAGVRLSRWDGDSASLRVEVFHVEWPATVLGALVFRDVSFVQLPSRTSWGYSVRLATHATASSARNDVDPADLVFELFARDGAEPSAFVVARSIEVRR